LYYINIFLYFHRNLIFNPANASKVSEVEIDSSGFNGAFEIIGETGGVDDLSHFIGNLDNLVSVF
jgi:hypothetical protein